MGPIDWTSTTTKSKPVSDSNEEVLPTHQSPELEPHHQIQFTIPFRTILQRIQSAYFKPNRKGNYICLVQLTGLRLLTRATHLRIQLFTLVMIIREFFVLFCFSEQSKNEARARKMFAQRRYHGPCSGLRSGAWLCKRDLCMAQDLAV